MGGTITHLIIADKILKKLPHGAISDAGMFYAGSLAPDAIHARNGYFRAMKKHTHMRDDIWDRDFMLPEKRDIFHQRIKMFIDDNRHRKGSLLDAYRGYVVHLLSDEVFVMTSRQKLVELLAKEKIDQSDPEFITKFAPEIHNNDLLIAARYPGLSGIKELLDKLAPFEIENYLSSEELINSRHWVNINFIETTRTPERPKYITEKDIAEYIDLSVEYSIEYMQTQNLLLL